MTHVNVGDRVRVTLPEIVGEVSGVDPGGYLELALEGVGDCDIAEIHRSHVEVLSRAFKVGDAVTTRRELEDLPPGAVVRPRGRDWAAAAKASDGWYFANSSRYAVTADDIRLPATVIYLEETA